MYLSVKLMSALHLADAIDIWCSLLSMSNVRAVGNPTTLYLVACSTPYIARRPAVRSIRYFVYSR